MLLIAAVGGALRAAGLYLASDLLLLTDVPLSVFLACTLAMASVASAALLGTHRSRLAKAAADSRGLRVALLHGLVLAVAMGLFCYGLKHCGPIRAILVEASQVALVAAAVLPLRSLAPQRATAVTRRRAGLLLIVTALVLLLGTHGSHPHRSSRGRAIALGPPSTAGWPQTHRGGDVDADPDAHGCGGAPAHWWWPTHVLGEGALLAAALLMAVHQRAARPLARALGGPRHLFTLTTATAAAWCAPLALWQMARAASPERARYLAAGPTWRCLLFSVLGLAGSHQAQVATAALPASLTAVASLTASFGVACVLDSWRAENAARGCPTTIERDRTAHMCTRMCMITTCARACA